MPELTSSTREAARRIGVTETALRKAEQTGRITREPGGQWDVDKTRRRMVETADPIRSPLAASPGISADATPFARLKVAELALKVEARRLACQSALKTFQVTASKSFQLIVSRAPTDCVVWAGTEAPGYRDRRAPSVASKAFREALIKFQSAGNS